MTTEQLQAQLLQLPAHVRAQIAEALLASLEESDSELDVAWADEAEQRAAEIRSDATASIPSSQAHAHARSKLG